MTTALNCTECGIDLRDIPECGRCSGCRKTMYCGTDCQSLHWEAEHREQCSRAYLTPKATSGPGRPGFRGVGVGAPGVGVRRHPVATAAVVSNVVNRPY